MTPHRSSAGLATLGLAILLTTGTARGQDAPVPSQILRPLDGSTVPARDHAQWEREIAAFEAKDREHMPAKGGILFTGSSVIRLWKTLGDDFAGLPVINRGFGGSEIADATHFAERIIFPHEPKQIVLRAGGNDIHNGRLPSEVAADFQDFVRTVHRRLPRTEILYIGVNPAPVRWGETDKMRDLNRRIRALALEMPFVTYIDGFDLGLDPSHPDRADPDVFVADRLHFNAEGYKRLTERVRPYLPLPKR